MHKIMNPRPMHAPPALRALALPLLALALAAVVPYAAATEDPGYRSYRCAVLGDTRACPAPPAPQSGTSVERRIEPGPYATYLMSRRGLGRDAAVAEAADIGEVPVLRIVSVTRRTLTDLERYERWAGRPVAPERTEVTLSATPLAPASALAQGSTGSR